MSKNKSNESVIQNDIVDTGRSNYARSVFLFLRRRIWVIAAVSIILLVGIGAMAKNGWLPNTDPLSGKKTGWFGKELPKNASSSWNPLAAPLPTPTPQLSKEYIYAGSRLLAVEDAGANAAPPADLAVWRPSTGTWWVLGGQGSAQTTYQYGASGDTPMPGDYDGDGKTDFAVYRSSNHNWYLAYSAGGGDQFPFGASGDAPVAADFDGDGKTDPAVFRPNDPTSGSATWYILQSSDSQVRVQQFGLSSDVPAPADYDGDGKADITVRRNSNTTFYSYNSSTLTVSSAAFGTSGDVAVSADYDGDGKANYALKSGNSWIILNAALTSTSTVTWQNSGDEAVQNDYDGDGIVDIAVWRSSNGNWYIRQSASGSSLRQVAWGVAGDIPVPAFYRR